ncbi:DUF2283 domain-containing protein [Methylomagnum sp.]
MNNPIVHHFPEQDVIHLAITNEEEAETLELSPNITAELNADGDLIGVEILKASAFMSNLKLDQEEQDLLNAFEADEFESVQDSERKAYLAQAAGATLTAESLRHYLESHQ